VDTTAADTTSTTRKRARGRWRKLIPYAIGAAILVFIVLGLRPKPAVVELAHVNRGPLVVSVLEEGKTRIRHRFLISAPVAGYLNRVSLRAGDPIVAGETVLATIEAEPARFLDPRAVAENEARLNAAKAAKLRADAQLDRARAALDLAKKDRDRAKSLRDSGAIAQRDWDAAENHVAILSRELRSAEFAVQVAQSDVAQAEATLRPPAETPAAVAEPLKITAPVSGFVLNVAEENARTVGPGTPIMEVGDPADLEAEIELLSSDAVAVAPGADVLIEQWGGPKPLHARVTVVEPGGFTKISALGVEEQRVKVRVEFVETPPKNFPLGDRFRVEARIVTWHGDNVLQAPLGALFRRGNDWMTFVAEGGVARLRKVDIGHNNGVSAEILGGLREGEAVVLHPPDTLADGGAIRGRSPEKQ
jgi:HlyD family secretion protein